MKKFMQAARLSGLLFLIVLASVGISISGGVPVLLRGKKEDQNEIKIEMVDAQKDEEHWPEELMKF